MCSKTYGLLAASRCAVFDTKCDGLGAGLGLMMTFRLHVWAGARWAQRSIADEILAADAGTTFLQRPLFSAVTQKHAQRHAHTKKKTAAVADSKDNACETHALCATRQAVAVRTKHTVALPASVSRLLGERVVQLVLGERVIGTDHDGAAAREVSVGRRTKKRT